MANLQNLPRRKKPLFLSSLGRKVKSALAYGMATDFMFLVRNLSLIGGLVLLASEAYITKNRKNQFIN